MKFLSHNLEIYTFNCTVHGTNIRNKLQLHQLNYTGNTKIFNELPEYIAGLVADKKHFISTLKSLIDKSFYSHEEFIND